MRVRQHSETKYVLDVNTVAIYLVENHPGYPYITELLDLLIKDNAKFVLFDFLPLRVYWIMTRKWKIPEDEAEESLQSFLRLPNLIFVCLNASDILDAFSLAHELSHDVFDTTYLVLAKKTHSRGIITTDTDFERLCDKLGIEYLNPIPKQILKKFASFK